MLAGYIVKPPRLKKSHLQSILLIVLFGKYTIDYT